MPSITLKNIPNSLYIQIKDAASIHHRSLNSEILYCVERTLGTHKINVSEHIEITRKLRAKTAQHSLSDQELNDVKNEGRPWLLWTPTLFHICIFLVAAHNKARIYCLLIQIEFHQYYGVANSEMFWPNSCEKKLLNIDEVLLIIQQAEKLLTDHDYEISSAHIMQLVKNSQCSAYDCEFVALAQYLDVPLITADKKILHEFPDISNTINIYLA